VLLFLPANNAGIGVMTEKNDEHVHYSRRRFLSAAVVAPILAGSFPLENQAAGLAQMLTAFSPAVSAKNVKIASPGRHLEFQLLNDESHLQYGITFRKNPVVETSLMGMKIDEVDLSQHAEIGRVESYRTNETYPSRGVHSEAIDHCNGVKVSLRHPASNTNYTLEVRAYDNGVAFRHIVPGNNKLRIPDEATVFTIPAGSSVWFHDFEGHYEGIHTKKEISEVKPQEWAAPPLTFKLPNGAGYASLTEGALMNYAGMGFQANGQRGFKTVLGHALPVSHPFDLRYGALEAKRLAVPAAMSGTIITPWRVVMAGIDLNKLVNCDIISNVSPPPDHKLFPAGPGTEWIKPGRAVWKYLDGGENTLEGMKEFSRLAGELGFEYNLLEGFWQRWTEAQMRELVDYSRQHKVGIWVWKHSRELRTSDERRKFFQLCNDLGVAGVKIDFFDHEAKEIIDLYQTLLREAAEHKLMLDFHGANKPAGESRTWPNEMTREAIRGLEYRNTQTRAVHNTTLPFTRMLAGHADYSVMHFGERRRETSWAHQIASAGILTSPVLIYAAHPKNILENPAAGLIKSIPSVWDETVALPSCEIGEVAAFARRRETTWFLAIMNGPAGKTVRVPLSFLGNGEYQAMLVRDLPDEPAAVKIDKVPAKQKESLVIELRSAGGFIGRFTRGKTAMSNH
jgi:alpha-glucosidase